MLHPSAKYQVLFSFGSNAYGLDGANPVATLVDVNATLYGTTEFGGTHGSGSTLGPGTVFSISTSGKEAVLHSFTGGSDGGYPLAGMTAVNGVLYGTTSGGGEFGGGTVFTISASGSEVVLHSFGSGADGASPRADLLVIKDRLYGTTYEGGTYGNGTLFSITSQGKETLLHSFSGTDEGGTDGGSPAAGVIVVKDTLYGTTQFGGSAGTGTVFGMNMRGKETVLYSFGGALPAAEDPVARVIYFKGALYGTTGAGGANGWGTVFSISKIGTNERVLHSFGKGDDGIEPLAGLTDVNGNLYGTTVEGGSGGRGSRGSLTGYGTVFRVNAVGNERVLHSFADGYYNDGIYPSADLTNVNGTLYGTTSQGGIRLPSCPHSGNICDYGTVFAVKP
jgi:uncharacterized repeat protein (TIGR03803 family)